MIPKNPTTRHLREIWLTERLDWECPPFWAYAIALKHRGGPWIGVDELCKRSGLARRTVIRIGSRVTWSGVNIDVAAAFLWGCGLRLNAGRILDLKWVRSYLRRQIEESRKPFSHLSDPQFRNFSRLCKLWNERHREG